MKSRFPCAAALAFMLAISAPLALWAQDQNAAPSDTDQGQDSGLKNYLSRTFKFSGSIRERWEATDGPFSVTPADSYVLSEVRLGLLFRPSSWLHFFAEAQDSRVLFYQTTPSNQQSNPFDLHQA